MRTTGKIALSTTAIALAATALVYPWLPEPMPVHWDLSGHPNGWASRPFGAFMLPAFMAASALFDVARRGANQAMGTVVALVNAFFLVTQLVVLHAALTDGELGSTFWLAAGVFFAASGLVLPRVRMNRWVGVRTPWSLSSPEAWARSQRVGGMAMCAAGLLIMMSAASSSPAALALRVLAVLGAAVVSVAYSYLAARTST